MNKRKQLLDELPRSMGNSVFSEEGLFCCQFMYRPVISYYSIVFPYHLFFSYRFVDFLHLSHSSWSSWVQRWMFGLWRAFLPPHSPICSNFQCGQHLASNTTWSSKQFMCNAVAKKENKKKQKKKPKDVLSKFMIFFYWTTFIVSIWLVGCRLDKLGSLCPPVLSFRSLIRQK